MSATRVTRQVNAPRDAVYRALLDSQSVAKWMVPNGMTSKVHAFDAHEGGAFRISLTYEESTGAGKSSAHTDTYNGRFVKLIPNQRIEETLEFETRNPSLQGRMAVTFSLEDAEGSGTIVSAVHDNLPSGLSPAENEMGWHVALAKLASLVETE